MEYNKIIAVTGLPGLYELLSSKSDGAIVRSLDDKSTRFVANRVHNFSHLESIEIYTVRENVNLVDVLKAMEKSDEKLPEDKDNSGLKAYFGKVYPDLDFERVYTSDLRKMVKWFIVLKKNDIEIKLSEASQEEALVEEAIVEDAPAEAPAKKKAAAAKEKAAPAAEATEEAGDEEKPKAKKPAAKKKATPAAEAEEAPAAEKPKKAAKKKGE